MQKKTDDAGTQISALLGSRLDVQNFCRIWRMKEFFGSSEEGGDLCPRVIRLFRCV